MEASSYFTTLFFSKLVVFPSTVSVYQLKNTWATFPCKGKRKMANFPILSPSPIMAFIHFSPETTGSSRNLMATRVDQVKNAQWNWFHINHSFYRNNPRSFRSMVFVSAWSSVEGIHYDTHPPHRYNINIQIVTENDLIDNSHFSMKSLFLRCQIYGK